MSHHSDKCTTNSFAWVTGMIELVGDALWHKGMALRKPLQRLTENSLSTYTPWQVMVLSFGFERHFRRGR